MKEEQIDEISKNLAMKYYRKAGESINKQYATRVPDEKTLDKRYAGKKLAVAKAFGMKDMAKVMAKEETISEKAPPGAKFERMVKHIKAGYSKDGLTKKEKGIAYATAWKAKKRESED